jgi:hypothetical protein
MPRPKKGDPELLLVSFCDIVTIVVAALFMAMIVVIDESGRIPVIRPTPMTKPTTNAPVYFECRRNQVFPVDREGIMRKLKEADEAFGAQAKKEGEATEEALKTLAKMLVTNEFYRVDSNYLLVNMVALRPSGDRPGATKEELDHTSTNVFRLALDKVNPTNEFVAFIVRDDSFPVFRKAREICTAKGYLNGWEYVAIDEPLFFRRIAPQ